LETASKSIPTDEDGGGDAMNPAQSAEARARARKRRGLTLVALAYVTALAAAWGTLAVLAIVPPIVPVEGLLYRTLAANLVATFVIFGWSVAHDNSSFYDAYWSLGPIAIMLYWLNVPEASEPTLRTWGVFGVIAAWGIRLTFNWARGWSGLDHEDWRYVAFREMSPRFYWAISLGGIHLFPTLIVFAGLAAAYPSFLDSGRAPGWIDLLAVGIGLTGIWLEWQADRQLNAFVRSDKRSGSILRSGLWRYSRHPNYLGEILIWWSLFMFGLSADPKWAAWAVAAPAAMTAMFLFVSIPMLEKRSLERRPGYQRVIDETSMLIPLPRRVSRADSERR
jgi:steroid 5-alpha reductase family enzyme